MGLTYEKEYTDFFNNKKDEFLNELLNEAVNAREKVKEIQRIGNIDLLSNAHNLVMYSLSGNDEVLEAFAKKEGIAWASHDLTLDFKLEWVQSIRRTLWRFLQRFEEEKDKQTGSENFYNLEKQVNDRIDRFLTGFFLNYSEYKDQLIKSQRELVENLSVPIIPISDKVCVLPLIGEIDVGRASRIEEKTLKEIGSLRIETIVMDFSGIAHIDNNVIDHIIKTIDGSNLMGCSCVITGLRSEIVKKFTSLNLKFESKAATKATLQQALEDYFVSS
ncbi:STAS domain-containing protein [Bacillus shivajii]|uniref:STAS domain-containing protein n=1 Tax=Bacillus shivajii TaxID=1983719 RepID=UPI001CFBC78C|nr:STAS domain-containing protein [Bacillus shivajii]UCZ53692.1 STAS domain-containing protein [Bacillus shivajii]